MHRDRAKYTTIYRSGNVVSQAVEMPGGYGLAMLSVVGKSFACLPMRRGVSPTDRPTIGALAGERHDLSGECVDTLHIHLAIQSERDDIAALKGVPAVIALFQELHLPRVQCRFHGSTTHDERAHPEGGAKRQGEQ
jgi:hypothetical protein